MAIKATNKETTIRKIYKNPKVQDLMRTEILIAAARAAEKKNFDVISMDDVARELGGSKGTIYYYFKSKDELISAMVLYVYAKISDALLPIYQDISLPPREKLDRIIKQHIITLLNDWYLHRALWTNTWWAALNKKDFKYVMDMRKVHRKAITDLMFEIVKNKKEKPAIIKRKTRLIMGLTDSMLQWYRPGGSDTPEELADMTVQMIYKGLLNS